MLLARCLSDPFGGDRAALAAGRYGVIEVADATPVRVHLRYWPKISTALDAEWFGRKFHDQQPGGRCWLYYNQPRRFPNFLALSYILSERGCSFATFRRAVFLLDEVARVKRTDALLCDAWNLRISDRLFARWGWEAHKPERWHRNFIKRFYGVYPEGDAHTRATALQASGC
jgi:hypothetical protein